MQLSYDKDIILLEYNEDYFIYSPMNHTRITVNEYSHFLIQQIVEADGVVDTEKIITCFSDQYDVELTAEDILEQVNLLVEMEIFFNSDEDLHTARETLLNQYEIEDKVPPLVYLLLTYRCNFSCSYCYLRDTNKDVQELSTEEWLEIIDRLKKMGVRRFVLTGGEPLVREDFVEILQACKTDQTHVSLLTNGSLLNEKFDQINPLIDSTIISLDSFEEEVNTLNRSDYGFNEILKAIERFSEVAPEKIKVRAVITKHNMDQINEFTERMNAEYGIKTMRTLVNPICPEEVELVPDMTGRMAIDEDRIESLNFSMKYRKCGACSEVMALNPAGDIFPCQAVMNPEFRIANISDDNWLDTFLRSKVRKDFTDLNLDRVEVCKDCAYRYLCGGCCPAISYNVYGRLDHHVSFYCDYLKERSKDTLALAKGKWVDME